MRLEAFSDIIAEVVYMPKTKTYPQFVVIPVEIFEGAESLDDLEDWLIANNEELVARLREAREQHRRGETKTLEEVEKELGL